MPGNLINFNAATSGFYNPYAGQYGSQLSSMNPNSLGSVGSVASLIPYVGPILGAAANFGAQALQNSQQKRMYEDYMSPQARMHDMMQAGINPNAAAQGVSGSNAPQMNAAPPTNAFSSLGEALGNSANTALTGKAIQAQIDKTKAETNLTNSLDTKQTIENKYFENMQAETLERMVQENRITKSTANMLSQDEFYHGAEAFQHFQQTVYATGKLAQELQNMQQDFLNKCAEYQLLLMEQGKTQAEIAELWSRVGLNKAQIEHLNHVNANLDASKALMESQKSGQDIENDILSTKRYYEQYMNDVLSYTGFDMRSSSNHNYLRLCAESRTEEAEKLMLDLYDYTKGQYGAQAGQTREWIKTGTGALAAVAGAIMLFVPGLQAPGAALLVGGTSLGASGLSGSSKQTKVRGAFINDPNDYSHIFD